MEQRLKVIVCDDDDFYIGDISRLLTDYAAHRHDLNITVMTYTRPFALLDDLDNGTVGDIYLIDVYMDVMDGVTLARSLRNALPEAQIVFLTTSHEHAVEAFEVGAAHYLVKPISKDGFYTAMERATAALIKMPVEQFVCSSSGGCIEIIPLADIILVESRLKEQRLNLVGGRTILVHQTLTSIFEKLSENKAFISPHRSFIVNLQHALKISTNAIVMVNGATVPLSRNNFITIKERFMQCQFPHTCEGAQRNGASN